MVEYSKVGYGILSILVHRLDNTMPMSRGVFTMTKMELLKAIIEKEQELVLIGQAMQYGDITTLYGQALRLDYDTTLDTLYMLREQYTHDVVGIEVPPTHSGVTLDEGDIEYVLLGDGAITVDRSEAVQVGGKSKTTIEQETITQEEINRLLEVPFEDVFETTPPTMGYVGYKQD